MVAPKTSLLLLVLAAAAGAQPSIWYRGVVNDASFSPAGLPNGSIAQGSVFSIFGSNLGPAQAEQVPAFPIANTLAGVSITVTQYSTTVNALPLFVSAGQINALMPSNTPLGLVSVRVIYNNATSNPSTVNVVGASFGLFAANNGGSGPGAIQDVTLKGEPVTTNKLSAKPGDDLSLWGTGLGPVSFPDNVAPTAGNLPTPTAVFVGGVSAQILYNGRSPCCAGIDQIVITVPPSAPQGCWVPVYVQTNGSTVSNVVTIPIKADGGACAEPSNPLAAAFNKGGNLGALQLIRSDTYEDIGTVSPIDVEDDNFTFDLSQNSGGPFAFGGLFSTPPAGTCTVLSGAGDYWHSGFIKGNLVVKHLDAGALSLTGPSGSRSLTPLSASDYGVFFGSYAPFVSGLPDELYLNVGNYKISATGGSDIGPFTASVTQAAQFTWTNRDQLAMVDRTTPLTLSWTGLPSGQRMAVLGGNADLPSNSSAVFYCIAPPGATSFTIPAAILSAIPPTRYNIFQSKGVIYLTNVLPENGVRFTASGLDAAFALAGYLSGKMVVFQ